MFFLNPPNSGHAKQNLQGVYKIRSAPVGASRGVLAVLRGFGGGLLFWRGSASDLSTHNTLFVYTGSVQVFDCITEENLLPKQAVIVYTCGCFLIYTERLLLNTWQPNCWRVSSCTGLQSFLMTHICYIGARRTSHP